MIRLFSLIFMTFLLWGCNKIPFTMDWEGKWNFKSYKAHDIQALYQHFKIRKSGEIDEFMLPLVGADYVFLNEGKAYSLSGMHYQSGDYVIQDDFIWINGQKAFQIIEGNPDRIILKPLGFIFNQDDATANDVFLTYEKDHQYTTFELDYTAPKYNAWRNQSKDKEKRQDIINRLKQQVEYSRIYFEKESKLHQMVKTIGVELPFLFYNNGVVLEKFHPAQKWLKYYQNYEDQTFAYNMLLHAFKQSTYEIIEADDILAYNSIIFNRMQDYLETLKVSIPSEEE